MTIKPILNSSLAKKDFLAVFILIVNAFSWYFPLYLLFENTLIQSGTDPNILSVAFGVHYVAVIGFAMAGVALVKKFPNRNIFLTLWIIFGVIASIFMILLETGNIGYVWPVSFLLGISLGLGFPSCLACFGDFSVGENAGRQGGITYFASGICILLLGLLANILSFSISVLVFATWRGIGLVLFLLVRPEQNRKEKIVDIPYKLILTDKSSLLYLIPWIMFCLVNFLEKPVVSSLLGTDIAFMIQIAEFGIGGVTALIGGLFADSVGRKRVIIFGFIMLGIGYAVLGLFPDINLSWYSHIILDGIAWGIFALMFFMVVWAELAGNRMKEKYYLIGILPFLVSTYVQILFTPYAELIPITAAFSLASFFLFLAVLPLLYAPETLPEKQIELRRLRKYMEKAKKVREKYQKNK